MKSPLQYRKADIEKVSDPVTRVVNQDLYVFLPSVERYVRFVQQGEALTDVRLEALRRHADTALYVAGSVVADASPELQEVAKQIEADLSTEDLETLSVEVEAELADIYRTLSSFDSSDDALGKLENMATRVLDLVAPEVKNIRAKLLANVRYLPLMNASAAISTVGVLCAHSNGISSRKSFRELALASFLMDLSLGEITAEVREAFLLTPEKLPSELLSELQQHPLRSYNLALDRLPSLPEQIRQLILNHHELFNGRGYPRGLRSDVLFPMARFLALAVDIYEHLCRKQASKGTPNVTEVLYELLEPHVEPHLRRHSRQVLLPVFAYLDLPLSSS